MRDLKVSRGRGLAHRAGSLTRTQSDRQADGRIKVTRVRTMTTTEVAVLAGCCTETVRRAVKRGVLGKANKGRYIAVPEDQALQWVLRRIPRRSAAPGETRTSGSGGPSPSERTEAVSEVGTEVGTADGGAEGRLRKSAT